MASEGGGALLPHEERIGDGRGPKSDPVTTCNEVSELHGLTIAGDLYHTFAIERPPSALAFFTGDSKITATNDGRLLAGSTSAFDFLRVARIELKLAESTISLDKFHADDMGTSVKDELLDDGGFVHGRREGNGNG